MKFRVSGKDLSIFGIFAAILLYLCSLITSNIHSLGATGSFAGLSPIPGLTTYLGATLIIFVIFLVIIFSGVSSYIFERKDGIGFEIKDKDNKGYSRWAKDKEIKNDKDIEVVDPMAQETEAAGIPLVNDGKRLWVDNGEYHNLVIGATGSGKSQTCVEPMVEILIKKGESMIITDPKGELYHAAAEYMKKRGYNVVVLNFRDPQRGNAWNPLTLPFHYYQNDNKDKAVELLNDVALNILYDPNNKSGDPFWEKSSADYFAGLALGLFEDAKEEEVNLNSISLMSTVGEDKFAASNYIKEYFTMKGEDSTAYGFASNTINSPAETKGGILSVFRQKIRQFATQENLSEMLSYSDFDMQSIGKQKTAVFIVIHDEKTTYHGLATIFIKQCYETLIDVAQKNGGKLPFRTNFILDEFANMPPLRDVTTMVTAARSRKMRFTFIIQNFAQLKSVYGNEDAETIKGNCGNLVYLISTELAALEEISKMCGEVKSSDKDKTASTPLVTVTDLQKLKLFEAIIIRWRMAPFKTKYTPNFKMDWGHEHNEIDFPSREKKPVQKFDIKTFVKEKKRTNMLNSLDNKDGGASNSPFGGGFGGGSSPFGSAPNPFAGPSSPSDSGLFGGMGGGLDLDAMMKDIDRKIAELDAEEARQKEEMEKKKSSATEDNKEIKEAKEIKEVKETTAPIELPKFDDIDTKIEPSIESKEEKSSGYNIFDTKPNTHIDSSEISIGNEKANIAVATSSPIDEDDFAFDDLPKVEEASIIQPSYSSGTVVKTDDNSGYNIYDRVPNLMDDIKRENPVAKVRDDGVLKNQYNMFNDEIKETPIEEPKRIINESIETNEKPNVNIDPDKVVVDNHSVISDDEFFDDFFGDD